jgi:Xaa-Pro aminopeptidase
MSAVAVSAARRRRLVALLEEHDLDLLVLYGNAWQNDSLRYAADFGILEGEGIAVVGRDAAATLYLDEPVEVERAGVECSDATVSYAPNLVGAVLERLAAESGKRIAAGPATHLPHGLVAQRERLGYVDATPLVDRLLMVKCAEELDRVRAAAKLADDGYAVFREAARPGRRDYELVAEIEAFFRGHGVQDNFMIVGVGGPEVRGMAPPSGKRLAEGAMVTTELTPCVDGYYAQICRTLVVGTPSAEQRAAHAVYDEALVAGIAAIRPGASAADVARAENEVFRRYGLGDYVTSEYTRVRGHGVGLFPDTKPHILEDVPVPLEPGMSLVVHPNTYHPVVGYLVHGDTVLVGQDGAEVLTGTAREIFATPLN